MTSERWFVKIDGIKGDSTESDHEGEIELESWSWGVSNTATVGRGGAGGGAGRAVFQDVRFRSEGGAASPALFLACAAGTHLRSARLSGISEGGEPLGFKVTMEDILVTAFEIGDDPSNDPRLQFSMGYGRIKLGFVPMAADGEPGTEITAGWDVTANRNV